MSKDLIRYDLLVQDALKGVVRKVLADAARDGLSGDHHFYVSFRTDFPGVRISQRLREKYPQDMTIVLQHQFWDLAMTEHTFEVGLSFSGIPERLLIPFDALTGFFDPSVQFGLKFEINDGAPAAGSVALPRGAGSEPAQIEPQKPSLPAASKSHVPKLAPAPKAAPVKAAEKAERSAKAAGKDDAGASGEVVSLDSFRKKS
jgi:uncharacterized protein